MTSIIQWFSMELLGKKCSIYIKFFEKEMKIIIFNTHQKSDLSNDFNDMLNFLGGLNDNYLKAFLTVKSHPHLWVWFL